MHNMYLQVVNLKKFTRLIASKDIAILNFFKGKLTKEIWNAKTTRDEINLLISILSKLKDFVWEIPIRYLIPVACKCTVLGDTYLNRGGAFYEEFQFEYYVK